MPESVGSAIDQRAVLGSLPAIATAGIRTDDKATADAMTTAAAPVMTSGLWCIPTPCPEATKYGRGLVVGCVAFRQLDHVRIVAGKVLRDGLDHRGQQHVRVNLVVLDADETAKRMSVRLSDVSHPNCYGVTSVSPSFVALAGSGRSSGGVSFAFGTRIVTST
jgi:hypothetical protein